MAKYQPSPIASPNLWNFEPDDNAESFYIEEQTSMSDLLSKAHAKWPDGFADLVVSAEYIHTRSITYDLYDPTDYDCFLLVTRIKE